MSISWIGLDTRFLSRHAVGNGTTAPGMAGIFLLKKLACVSSSAPSSSSRRADDDTLTGLHVRGVFGAQTDMSLLPAPVGGLDTAHPDVLSTQSFLASFQPIRVIDPAFGEDRHLYRKAKFNISDHSISATVLPIPARVGS